MNDDLKLPDPAAVFGCALLLWKERKLAPGIKFTDAPQAHSAEAIL
jgi:hypothetical protein